MREPTLSNSIITLSRQQKLYIPMHVATCSDTNRGPKSREEILENYKARTKSPQATHMPDKLYTMKLSLSKLTICLQSTR